MILKTYAKCWGCKRRFDISDQIDVLKKSDMFIGICEDCGSFIVNPLCRENIKIGRLTSK